MMNGTLAQIEKGALINQASADLLAQFGVRLTSTGQQALLAGNTAAVRAETGLAKGITAQAGGESVEALFNFTQAAAFAPSQMEALARLTTLSSSISGGSLSERIVNDIQARDRWLTAFKETARFFNEHPPFEITFDPSLIQEGETDYANRTATLAMRVALGPSEAGFAALNALLGGLEKTGRRSVWGFEGWPLKDVNPKTPGTVVFEGKRSISFKLDAELLNEQGKLLSKSSVTLNTGDMVVSETRISAPGIVTLARFANVKADDLSPVLTIAITAINGVSAKRLNATGYMRIDAGDLEERYVAAQSGLARIPGGTFTTGRSASEDEYILSETTGYNWLGISLLEPDKETLASLGLEGKRGLMAAQVFLGSPADKGGISPGDFITHVDGKEALGANQLTRIVGDFKPGDRPVFTLIRDGAAKDIQVHIEARTDQVASDYQKLWPGVHVVPLTNELKDRFKLKKSAKGVIAEYVQPGSPASIIGLKDGDLIISINGENIKDLPAYFKLLREKTGKELRFGFIRNATWLFGITQNNTSLETLTFKR